MLKKRDGSEYFQYERLTVEYRDASHRYWLIDEQGTRVPVVNVTSALKVLDKPALLSWAEAAGAEGAAFLARQGELDGVDPAEAVERVRLFGLGMAAKRDAGAGRGSSIHKVLERWGTDRSVPNLTDHPPEHRGFVQGLARWLLTAQPEPSSVERCVGSVSHAYAGRMDMRAVIAGRDCVVDLKTNPKGRVYDEAHLQARAYAIADVECGQPEPDGVVIVAVGDDSSFEMVQCEATAEDWLNALACSKTVARLRALSAARWREAQKAAA